LQFLDFGDLLFKGDCWLNLAIKLERDLPWGPKGHEVARWQFEIPYLAPEIDVGVVQPKPKFSEGWSCISEDKEGISLVYPDLRLFYDRNQGHIASFEYKGMPLLERGFAVNLWRAPIDNDGGWGASFDGQSSRPEGEPMFVIPWRQSGLDVLETRVESCDLSLADGSAAIDTHLILSSKAGLCFPVRILIQMSSSGAVRHGIWISNPHDVEVLPTIPRVGGFFQLPRTFQRFSWLGRGPQHSYADRKQAMFVGRYDNRIADNHWPFPRPQENGNKTDVRWASVSDEQGLGILVGSLPGPHPLLNVSVHNYSLECLTKARTSLELVDASYVTLNVDLAQTGVGGDDSWTPRTKEKYRLTAPSYHYGFWLRPFGSLAERDALLQLTVPTWRDRS
jgi:hypothetical protein